MINSSSIHRWWHHRICWMMYRHQPAWSRTHKGNSLFRALSTNRSPAQKTRAPEKSSWIQGFVFCASCFNDFTCLSSSLLCLSNAWRSRGSYMKLPVKSSPWIIHVDPGWRNMEMEMTTLRTRENGDDGKLHEQVYWYYLILYIHSHRSWMAMAHTSRN